MCQSMRMCGRGPAAPRRAVALVWTAIMLVVFIGLAGLVCDLGYVILTGTQLQSAADAAALAGAWRLRPTFDETIVRKTAQSVAKENQAAKLPVDLDDADIAIGTYDPATRTFTPDLRSPDAVKVVAHRTGGKALPLLFGPIFGVNTANVSRTAIASIEPGVRPALLILDPNGPGAFEARDSATEINITGGGIVVNSSHADAIRIHKNANLHAERLWLMPAPYGEGGTVAGVRTSRINEPLPDPLAHVPEPDYEGLPVEVFPRSGQYTPSQPGNIHYYAQTLAPQGTLEIMKPGIYVLGGGLDLGANDALIAHGVMFFIPKDAKIRKMTGTPRLEISSPALADEDPSRYFPEAEIYHGISMWQARGNKNEADLGGNEGIEVDGIMYFPSARLIYRGTSDSFSTQLIVWQLELGGNGTINLEYDGRSVPWAFLVQ